MMQTFNEIVIGNFSNCEHVEAHGRVSLQMNHNDRKAK